MSLSGAQIVVKALEDEGVKFSFGIPGTHNIELYDALLETEKIITILVTDEQSASFMADGVARASGSLAALNLVPSAGLTNAMSGIAEAFLDQVPMLVLSCGIRRDKKFAYQLHDVDQAGLARPVCKEVFIIKTHEELYPTIRAACRLAQKPPCGPVMVEVPVHLYLFPSELTVDQLQLPDFEDTPPSLNPQTLQVIRQCLHQSSSIGIYAGAGALGARDELLELAEKLDAIIFTTISGKGLFPENHPRWGWVTMGAAAPKEIQRLEKELDCLLAIGCRFGEVATGSYGFHPPKNLIHIDIDPGVFNKNFQAQHILQGEAREVLKTLLPLLQTHPTNQERLQRLSEAHQWIRKEQCAIKEKTQGVSPALFLAALQGQFGPQTIFVTDSGNGTFVAMELLRLTEPRSFLGPIDYSCMGYSTPAAIGAKLAAPDRPVVALIGDGAFLMTGLELLTAATYGIGVVACLLHDGELSQIAQFQRKALGREGWTAVHDFQADPLSRAMGVDYVGIQNDSTIKEGVRQAFEISQKGRPVLVDVAIDYSTPTYFTKGVVKTNLLRLPWKDRLRMVGRVLKRKITG